MNETIEAFQHAEVTIHIETPTDIIKLTSTRASRFVLSTKEFDPDPDFDPLYFDKRLINIAKRFEVTLEYMAEQGLDGVNYTIEHTKKTPDAMSQLSTE